MKKQIGFVFIILLASCGAGVVAHSTWYTQKGYPKMPWIKKAKTPAEDKPATTVNGKPNTNDKQVAVNTQTPKDDSVVSGANDSNDMSGDNKHATDPGGTNGHGDDSGPKVANSKESEPPANPCNCDKKEASGACVANIDCILAKLAEGTAFIIDAREDHDWNEAHLAGAIHVPSSAVYDSMENVMGVVPMQSDMIIVYCGGGDCEASKNVAEVLEQYGFTNVWVYEKGWQEIEASGRFGNYIEVGGG